MAACQNPVCGDNVFEQLSRLAQPGEEFGLVEQLSRIRHLGSRLTETTQEADAEREEVRRLRVGVERREARIADEERHLRFLEQELEKRRDWLHKVHSGAWDVPLSEEERFVDQQETEWLEAKLEQLQQQSKEMEEMIAYHRVHSTKELVRRNLCARIGRVGVAVQAGSMPQMKQEQTELKALAEAQRNFIKSYTVSLQTKQKEQKAYVAALRLEHAALKAAGPDYPEEKLITTMVSKDWNTASLLEGEVGSKFDGGLPAAWPEHLAAAPEKRSPRRRRKADEREIKLGTINGMTLLDVKADERLRRAKLEEPRSQQDRDVLSSHWETYAQRQLDRLDPQAWDTASNSSSATTATMCTSVMDFL